MQTSQEAFDAVTVLALLAGPILAVLVGRVLQKRSVAYNERSAVFKALIAGRYDALSQDRLRALALIEVVFYDEGPVVSAWRAWHEAVTNSSLNDAHGMEIRATKYYDLLTAMARVLGYTRLTRNEMERVYSPALLGQVASLRGLTEIEWYRLLKNSEHLGSPRKHPPPDPPELPPPL